MSVIDSPLEMEVEELRRRLASDDSLVVLDVREPWELEIVRLSGTLDIPMNHLIERIKEVPQDRPVAVLCRSGGRSMKVTQYLRQQGFSNVINVAGGILAWADRIDNTLAKY
ncbi:rhodanese-like domain-containing protein [Limibacillus halophilus]|uniref:Adenylyltransferase/sulfurtransferase n=1 Tax=Limibacillus halophilus TaxID=1579333 RepID=A0A839SRW4_9PROT|nr:rhodanese-like domain-containing protein [Limibacillus halophilus]MBB3065531.1 adenylyltransferase/sulfurtransferase [Limibacillus halophilus]